MMTTDTFITESGETRFDSCHAPAEHMRCLVQWTDSDREELEKATNQRDIDFFKGRIAGFELAIELLAGQILENHWIPY